MPENNVTVTVTADASQAKRAIDDLTNTIAADSQKMAELGRKIAEAGRQQLGLSPQQMRPGLDPQSQRALDAYTASLNGATTKTKELARESAAVGESAQRSGQRAGNAFTMFESILERMALRLIALQLIFDAIRAIGELIVQSIDWEKLSVRFHSFTNETGNAARNLTTLQQIIRTTGQSSEAVFQLERSYEMLGETATQAAEDTKMVAEYAAASGVPIAELGKAMQGVKLQIGTVEQLREVAYVLKDIAAVDIAASLEHAQAVLSQIEAIESRLYQLEQRRTSEAQRQSDAVEQFGNRFKLGEDILRRMVGYQDTNVTRMHVWQGGIEVATINMDKAGQAMRRMLDIGNQRIMQEQGINAYTLRQMEQYGMIDSSFVLQAYHRQVEENQRNQQYAHEDAQQNRRLSMVAAQVGLNQRLSGELQKHENLQKAFADYSATAAGKIDEMQKSFAQIGQDLPQIASAIAKFADAATKAADAMDRIAQHLGGGTPEETRQLHEQQRQELEHSGKTLDDVRRHWDRYNQMRTEERAGAHSGFAQADVDQAVREALTLHAWASTGRGIPTGAAGLPAMTLADISGMFPHVHAEVAAAQRGPGAATQQQLMDWAMGGGFGAYPGKYRQAQLMDWAVHGGVPGAATGAAQGPSEQTLQQILTTLQNMFQHDQQVFGQ